MANVINGTAGDDTLFGTAGDDQINGLGGNDTLFGDAGNDTLDGGAGSDAMFGGDGDDTYVVGAGDSVSEVTSTGTDSVLSSITITLGTNVENLTLTGAAAINGTGNTLDNVITGNSSNNILTGNAGADTLIGGAGDDTYFAVGDTDVITEGADGGIDTIETVLTYSLAALANVENLTLTGAPASSGTGNALNNVITGNDAKNILTGGAGNDTLDGAGGIDTLVGGTGDDTYVVDSTSDVITELAGEGTDTVVVSFTVALSPTSTVENVTLSGIAAINGTGNSQDNVLTGNQGANILDGGAGNDTLDGQAGNDTMVGGLGDDTYFVGAAGDVVTELANEGADTVKSTISYTLGSNLENLALTGAGFHGTGNSLNNSITGTNGGGDTLLGLDGTDHLYGLGGNDTLDGGVGADIMTGGLGNDLYFVANPADSVVESANQGTDTVKSAMTYTLRPNVENLILTGASAINGTGNALNNVITGNSADNVLTGLAGNDTYVVDSAGDVVTELAAEGTDTVRAGFTYSLAALADVENLALTGTGNFNGTGNTLANFIAGNNGGNILNGGLGNDTLDGGAGNDTLNGGGGNDMLIGRGGINTMVGSTGNDTYVVSVATDVVTEAANAGTDTVQSAINYSLAALANVENLLLTGTGNFNATGNTLANVITGNSGNNILNGGAGADTLNGGAGADTMKGGGGNDTCFVAQAGDTVTELAGQGTDTVKSSITYTLPDNVENLTLTGAGNINGTGNTINNVLTGNAANNVLDGGSGNDTMAGGLGDDTYVVDAAGDVVTEGGLSSSPHAEGIDTVMSFVSYTLPSNVDNLTLLGTANINATGGEYMNVLTGNSGDNVLDGGTGGVSFADTDYMAGGLGNDTYVVNTTTDTVTEDLNAGTDLVLSSAATHTLSANVENLTLTGSFNINGTGNELDNVIIGNSGDNLLVGGAGNDTVSYASAAAGVTVNLGANGGGSAFGAGIGNDTFNFSIENVIGSAFDDTLIGHALISNTLTGGAGLDIFRFDALPNRDPDAISDFSVADDTIQLNDAAFTSLVSGALPDAQLRSGAGITTAADSDDFLIYDTATGALYYDADGSGPTSSAQQITTLIGAPGITFNDIVVI